MTDPTTRDPAASLEVACHRTITGNGSAWSWIDGPASLGALDNLRVYPSWRIENAYVVDAPALLAEVAELREALIHHMAGGIELQQALERKETECEAAQGALAEAIADCTANHDRAEAAEQVAREAVELVRRTSKKLDAYYKQSGGAYPGGEPMQTLAPAIATFLAHHGARTGDSNE